MNFDLKISGGLIVDGSGGAACAGDVGIKDGRIVALGEAPGEADQVIRADGAVVAPGFVDIHTHYDAQILWDRMLSISPWHGVTTVVMGNCGFGVAPTRPRHRELMMRTLEKVEGMSFEALEAGLGRDWPFETFPEYLDAIEARGSAINVAVLVGHTPVRTYVMGDEASERAARPEEVADMRAIVAEAVAAGALGFATSKAGTHVGYQGKPVPSRLAEFDEILDLAGALGDAGRGVIQATAGRDLSFDQFALLTERTGRTVTWTALLTGLALAGGDHRDQVARSDELVAQGYDVVPQVTARPLNFEYQFKEPFPFEPMSTFREAGVGAADAAAKKQIYADEGFRRAFAEKMRAGVRPTFRAAFAKTVISGCPTEPTLAERLLFEVAAERGLEPTALALDLALASDLEARFRMPVANHDEDQVEELLLNPNMVLGLSDAGAHASQLCDACLPTYLLGHWVREKQVLTLEQAIRMLTARPAEVFGIRDRGRLGLGLPADLVVFDPATVGDGPLERVHDLPGGADRLISEARGVEAVVVNGRVLRRGGADVIGAEDALPGKLLRGGQAA
ncbi:MAG: amidohydrolase family protein [Alphaproteobacteria bacterium]|jgi:N-acyl-D-aspartate/D-glutamate deacylase|nr:amidohydrolase family protein [Alphaproteobacteria bacterium]